MATLPPGIDADRFAAIRAFEDAVGPEWVFTSDEDLVSYRDHFSYQRRRGVRRATHRRISRWRGGIWPAAYSSLRGALRE